jgi:hypothetical protein
MRSGGRRGWQLVQGIGSSGAHRPGTFDTESSVAFLEDGSVFQLDLSVLHAGTHPLNTLEPSHPFLISMSRFAPQQRIRLAVGEKEEIHRFTSHFPLSVDIINMFVTQ